MTIKDKSERNAQSSKPLDVAPDDFVIGAPTEHEKVNPFGDFGSHKSIVESTHQGYSRYGDNPDEEAQRLIDGFKVRKGSALERNTPPARPGYSQRWISYATKTGDSQPFRGRFQDAHNSGWRSRDPGSVPKGFYTDRHNSPEITGGVLYFKGLVLCEKPTRAVEFERAEKRRVIEGGQTNPADDFNNLVSPHEQMMKPEREDYSQVLPRGFA